MDWDQSLAKHEEPCYNYFMKWKANSKPKEGDIRYRRKFAWFPVHCYIDTEMYYIWLETYQVKERYEKILVQEDGYYRYELGWKLRERTALFWEHESV